MPGSENDITIDSPSSERLTFCPTTSNCASPNTVWSTAQTVTLAAAEDTANFGGEVNGSQRIRHRASSADANYNKLTVFLTASEVENDEGILVPGFVDVPEGGSANFDVSLHVQPTQDVTVTISENTTGWGIDPDITVTSPANKTLTFTSSNWNIGQTVTVSAAQDDDFEGGQPEHQSQRRQHGRRLPRRVCSAFRYRKRRRSRHRASGYCQRERSRHRNLPRQPERRAYRQRLCLCESGKSGSGQDTDITIKDTDDSAQTGDQTGSILFTADNWSCLPHRNPCRTGRRRQPQRLPRHQPLRQRRPVQRHHRDGNRHRGRERPRHRTQRVSRKRSRRQHGDLHRQAERLRPSANVTVTIAEGTTAPNNDTDITVTSPSSKTLTFCSSSWGCTSPNTLWSTVQTVTLTADEDNDNDSGSRTINHTADSTDTNYERLDGKPDRQRGGERPCRRD